MGCSNFRPSHVCVMQLGPSLSLVTHFLPLFDMTWAGPMSYM